MDDEAAWAQRMADRLQPTPGQLATLRGASREDRASTAIRLPRSLLARLDVVCDERMVGRNLVITRAIEMFLDQLPPLEK